MQTLTTADAFIINLSTIHGVLSIPKTISNFAKLHYDYAKSWSLTHWYSKSWVWACLKYWEIQSIIKNYQLGKINTEEFVACLSDIFYFLKDNPQVKNPQRLLEDTWNSLIIWGDLSTEKLEKLKSISREKPIYFIANINPLYTEKLIELFQKNCPNDWNLPEEAEGKLFRIANNFFLCTSYKYNAFKKTGLIEKLKEDLRECKELNTILLVSQYKEDLAMAKELGIESQAADQFFTRGLAPIEFPIPTNANQTLNSISPNSLSYRPIFAEIEQKEEYPNTEKTSLLSKPQ